MKKGNGLGHKTLSLPPFNADGKQWDDAWSDGMWPGYGPPLPHVGREKQSATMRRRPSAFSGQDMERPNYELST